MPENLSELLRRELSRLDQQLQVVSKKREAIVSLLDSYSEAGAKSKVVNMPAPDQEKHPISTLDMAQQVLEKHGEMKAEELMEAIRQEFGIRPAHTLPQMLYIRARAKKRFYRTANGKFGVLSERRGRKKAA